MVKLNLSFAAGHQYLKASPSEIAFISVPITECNKNCTSIKRMIEKSRFVHNKEKYLTMGRNSFLLTFNDGKNLDRLCYSSFHIHKHSQGTGKQDLSRGCLADDLRCISTSFFSPHPSRPSKLQAH